MESYLEKKSSGLLTKWQRRYFRTEGPKIKYYATENENDVKGVIDYLKIVKIAPGDRMGIKGADGKDFTIFEDRPYELKADSAKEARAWIQLFQPFVLCDPKNIPIAEPMRVAIYACINHLEGTACAIEGCFRNTGSKLTLKRLNSMLLISGIDRIEDSTDPLCVGVVLKGLLRSLPESIFTNLLLKPVIAECNRMLNSVMIEPELDKIRELLSLIKETNLKMLHRLFKLFTSLWLAQKVTKLDPKTLAVAMAGCFMDTTTDSLSAPDMTPVFTVLCTHFKSIFPVIMSPDYVRPDINTYFSVAAELPVLRRSSTISSPLNKRVSFSGDESPMLTVNTNEVTLIPSPSNDNRRGSINIKVSTPVNSITPSNRRASSTVPISLTGDGLNSVRSRNSVRGSFSLQRQASLVAPNDLGVSPSISPSIAMASPGLKRQSTFSFDERRTSSVRGIAPVFGALTPKSDKVGAFVSKLTLENVEESDAPAPFVNDISPHSINADEQQFNQVMKKATDAKKAKERRASKGNIESVSGPSTPKNSSSTPRNSASSCVLF